MGEEDTEFREDTQEKEEVHTEILTKTIIIEQERECAADKAYQALEYPDSTYLSPSTTFLNEDALPPLCTMVLPLKSSTKWRGSLP